MPGLGSKKKSGAGAVGGAGAAGGVGVADGAVATGGAGAAGGAVATGGARGKEETGMLNQLLEECAHLLNIYPDGIPLNNLQQVYKVGTYSTPTLSPQHSTADVQGRYLLSPNGIPLNTLQQAYEVPTLPPSTLYRRCTRYLQAVLEKPQQNARI